MTCAKSPKSSKYELPGKLDGWYNGGDGSWQSNPSIWNQAQTHDLMVNAKADWQGHNEGYAESGHHVYMFCVIPCFW